MTSVTPKPGRTPLFVVYSPWKSFSTGFLEYLRDHAGATCIVDPFCGVGTALAVANELGLAAIGVERNPGRAAKARLLTL